MAYRILPLILMLIACLCGKCAIIYVLCRSPNMTMWRDKNALTLIMYTLYAKWTLFPDNLPNFPSFFRDREIERLLSQHLLAALNLLLGTNSLVL